MVYYEAVELKRSSRAQAEPEFLYAYAELVRLWSLTQLSLTNK